MERKEVIGLLFNIFFAGLSLYLSIKSIQAVLQSDDAAMAEIGLAIMWSVVFVAIVVRIAFPKKKEDVS